MSLHLCFSNFSLFRFQIFHSYKNVYFSTNYLYFLSYNLFYCGPGSLVGIATDCGLDGPGIESRWGAIFSAPVQTGPGAHPASCAMGTGSFAEVKYGRGVLLTTHHLLVPRSKNRVELYLYPPSVPHRACNVVTLPFF
jgi:hypothetical protein